MARSLNTRVIKVRTAVRALEPLLAEHARWQLQLELLQRAAKNTFRLPPTNFDGLVSAIIENYLSRVTDDQREDVLVKVSQSDFVRREGLESWLLRAALPQEPDFRIVRIIRRHRVERRAGRQDPRNDPVLPPVETGDT